MIAKSNFCFRVRRVSNIVSNIDQCRGFEAEGYFNVESLALQFADSLKDGKNYVYVFNNQGQPVHVIGPESN